MFQDATYYFFNVAPQFQSFNNGNWKALEMAVRDYAASKRRDINIYTGTFGQTVYPNVSGEQTPIYLYAGELVPAPLYYWKVVHDPEAGRAAAFVGLNDPHARVAPALMCKDT